MKYEKKKIKKPRGAGPRYCLIKLDSSVIEGIIDLYPKNTSTDIARKFNMNTVQLNYLIHKLRSKGVVFPEKYTFNKKADIAVEEFISKKKK